MKFSQILHLLAQILCRKPNCQKNMIEETNAPIFDIKELRFLRQVQTYLGGKEVISPNVKGPRVQESIQRIISYVQDKTPLDCIYDDEPLGFEKSDHQDKTVEVEDPLEELNLGDDQNPKVTYISSLLEQPFKEQLTSL